MATIETSADFDTPYLLAVREKGFEAYYRGFEGSFLQVVGIGACFHNLDSSRNPPTHLAEWFIAQASLLEPFARLRYDLRVATCVGSAVTQLLLERLNSGTQAEDLSRGRLPDRANTELFESLAWALGMCIVWFEEIEGEVMTRVFCRPEGHQWLFYGYFGFDGRKVYCFEHPTLRDHEVESPTRSCYQMHEQCNPIIVGQLIGELRSPPPEPSPDMATLRFLVEMASMIDPAVVPAEIRSHMHGLNQQWNRLLEQPEYVPILSLIGLDLVKKAVTAGAGSGPSNFHSLRECPRFSSTHSSPYIQHLNHLVHEDCLRAFLIQALSVNPSRPIKCGGCPSFFTEALVRQMVPHYQTIKEEALKRLQQRTHQTF